MKDVPGPARRCSALTATGQPCTQPAINGLDVPLCASHSRPHKAGRRPKHGYYASTNLDQLEYLHRVRPEDWVQNGGLAPARGSALQIRERDRDLHPPDPGQADIDLAIAALLHKMEILDALIFRAKEHELDITLLLSLYLAATSRLGRMVIERDDRAAGEHSDLLALLERANEELENREANHGP
jgi:hypothetical protein